jgi:hypothetical protein
LPLEVLIEIVIIEFIAGKYFVVDLAANFLEINTSFRLQCALYQNP